VLSCRGSIHRRNLDVATCFAERDAVHAAVCFTHPQSLLDEMKKWKSSAVSTPPGLRAEITTPPVAMCERKEDGDFGYQDQQGYQDLCHRFISDSTRDRCGDQLTRISGMLSSAHRSTGDGSNTTDGALKHAIPGDWMVDEVTDASGALTDGFPRVGTLRRTRSGRETSHYRAWTFGMRTRKLKCGWGRLWDKIGPHAHHGVWLSRGNASATSRPRSVGNRPWKSQYWV